MTETLITLDQAVLSQLQLLVPSGKRSRFVEAAISKALEEAFALET